MPHEVIGGLILGIIFGFGSAFLRHGKLVLFIVDVVASVIYFIITFIVIGRNRKKVEEHKQKVNNEHLQASIKIGACFLKVHIFT